MIVEVELSFYCLVDLKTFVRGSVKSKRPLAHVCCQWKQTSWTIQKLLFSILQFWWISTADWGTCRGCSCPVSITSTAQLKVRIYCLIYHFFIPGLVAYQLVSRITQKIGNCSISVNSCEIPYLNVTICWCNRGYAPHLWNGIVLVFLLSYFIHLYKSV